MKLTVSVSFNEQNKTTMKSINNNAPVICRKSILINAKPETIWALLTNIDQWTNWQTDITKSKLNGELKPDSTFEWKSGGLTINSTLRYINENKQIGWTGKTLGIYAIHNWLLTEENGQVKVEVEESMEGILASLFKSMFVKQLETGMQNWLDLLKKESEKR